MINYQNTPDYNQLRLQLLGGHLTGLWANDQYFMGFNDYPLPKYHYMTAKYRAFESLIMADMPELSYHLGGYGTRHNEAVVSFLGEAVERYAYAMTPRMLETRLVKASYREMVRRYARDLICPLDYINIYYSEQSQANYVTADMVIQWVKMQSLIDIGRTVWLPMQLVMVNSPLFGEDEAVYVTHTVSTGCACHETQIKSMTNALVEYLQLDAFNLWWYGGIKGQALENVSEKHLRLWFGKDRRIEHFLKHFTVKMTDISFDQPCYVIVCEIFSKDNQRFLPKYTVGLQGGLDKDQAYYRAFLECLAVLSFNLNLGWTDSKAYLAIAEGHQQFDNLDDNVVYYAKYGKPAMNLQEVIPTSKAKATNPKSLLGALKEVSQYAGFLAITPTNCQDMNLEVSRVVVPERLALCLPSQPAQYHPRFQVSRGIVNRHPHPLA